MAAMVPIHLEASYSYRNGTGTKREVSHLWPSEGLDWWLLGTPLIHFLFSMALVMQLMRAEARMSTERKYRNKLLTYLDSKLATSSRRGLWTPRISLPFFTRVMLILVLFGQGFDSAVKVFVY
jgi:hypothetical protein